MYIKIELYYDSYVTIMSSFIHFKAVKHFINMWNPEVKNLRDFWLLVVLSITLIVVRKSRKNNLLTKLFLSSWHWFLVWEVLYG